MSVFNETEEYRRGRADALAAVQEARARARRTSEYAHGYNSSEHIGGRDEGFELAEKAINGTLTAGQWSEYK